MIKCEKCNKKQHAREYAIIEGEVWAYDPICITCHSGNGMCSKCRQYHIELHIVRDKDGAKWYCPDCLIQPDLSYGMNPAFEKTFKRSVVNTGINAELIADKKKLRIVR